MMRLNFRTAVFSLTLALLCTAARPQQPPQPVIQVGALNLPGAVLTQNNEWSSLITILSLPDLDFYVEDPSTDAWLARNAQAFLDRGHYVITAVSYYKYPRACRADMVRSGFDLAHQNAGDQYRYCIRQISVDSPQNAISLLYSVMVFSNGTPDPTSILRDPGTRGFSDLGPDAQKAISAATELVAKQAHQYAIRNHLTP
jgi:hypothetical protein